MVPQISPFCCRTTSISFLGGPVLLINLQAVCLPVIPITSNVPPPPVHTFCFVFCCPGRFLQRTVGPEPGVLAESEGECCAGAVCLICNSAVCSDRTPEYLSRSTRRGQRLLTTGLRRIHGTCHFFILVLSLRPSRFS